jgi:hypothetical protein
MYFHAKSDQLVQFLSVSFATFPPAYSVKSLYRSLIHTMYICQWLLIVYSLHCQALNTWKFCLVCTFVIVSWHLRDEACSNKTFVILVNLFCVGFQVSVSIYVMYVLCLHCC